jgi:hypothetical protein
VIALTRRTVLSHAAVAATLACVATPRASLSQRANAEQPAAQVTPAEEGAMSEVADAYLARYAIPGLSVAIPGTARWRS